MTPLRVRPRAVLPSPPLGGGVLRLPVPLAPVPGLVGRDRLPAKRADFRRDLRAPEDVQEPRRPPRRGRRTGAAAPRRSRGRRPRGWDGSAPVGLAVQRELKKDRRLDAADLGGHPAADGPPLLQGQHHEVVAFLPRVDLLLGRAGAEGAQCPVVVARQLVPSVARSPGGRAHIRPGAPGGGWGPRNG